MFLTLKKWLKLTAISYKNISQDPTEDYKHTNMDEFKVKRQLVLKSQNLLMSLANRFSSAWYSITR